MLLRVTILALALTGIPAFADQAPLSGGGAGPIFRLGVSLIQLDVVVTDRRGRHVTGLGPDDFEVLQNGTPQPVRGAIYVQVDRNPTLDVEPSDTAGVEVRPDETGLTQVLQWRARREVAGRVAAIVVDDTRMSFSSIYFARDALKRFAGENFRPGDLVGIVRTSGSRFPEALTPSREELVQSIRRLSFRDARALATGSLARDCAIPGLRARLDAMLVNRMLARIDDVIETLRRVSGRKAIVLVSEGFGSPDYWRVKLQDLVDRANRADVVIYAIDPRGLEIPCAMDSSIALDVCMTQSGSDALHYIAGETGGFAVVDTSNLRGGLARIMNDQRGYYVIGYQPDSDTFGTGNDAAYHKVQVKAKRKGLKVRSRRGFYAIPTD